MATSRPTRTKNGTRTTATTRPVGSAFPGTIHWIAPLFTPTGFGDEARGFVKGLFRLGYPVKATPVQTVTAFARSVAADDPQFFKMAIDSNEKPMKFPTIAVLHLPATANFARMEGADYTVVRTMFETDGLAHGMVSRLNNVDEIWVPSQFNLETFTRAGVTTPIHVIGAGVDVRRFHPGVKPLPLPGARSTVFLAMFEWSDRKGWDVLLSAWAQAFGPEDDVSLVLRVYPQNAYENTDTSDATAELLVADALATLAIDPATIAPIITIGRHLPPADMPRLMAAADCYVAPSRGEGWGRPQHEAMATGLPVIATRWSGVVEFMNDDNSLLLDVERLVRVDAGDLPHYRAQSWAEPSIAHLVEHLRAVKNDPEHARAIGARARLDIENKWQWSRIAAVAGDRLDAIAVQLCAAQELQSGQASDRPRPMSLVLAHAEELLRDKSLLTSFAAAFTADDPVTLVVYGPGLSPEIFETELRRAAGEWGIDIDNGPKLHVLLPPTADAASERQLAGQLIARLTALAAPDTFVRVPLITPGDPRRLQHQLRLLETRASAPVASNHQAPAPRVGRDDLPEARLYGLFETAVGLGEAARRTLAAMEAAEIVCTTVEVTVGGLDSTVRFAHRQRPDASNWVDVFCVNAEVLLAMREVNGSELFAGRRRIGLWHWELECFPRNLFGAFDLLDEIWVSSEHTCRTIQAVTDKPVVVVPMPIAPRSTPLHGRADLHLPESYLFGFSFDFRSLSARKNPLGLVAAFSAAFAPGEGPRLVIKATGGEYLPDERAKLLAAVGERPDISIIEKRFTSDEQSSFIGLVDCYVSLHRAEGFGLTLAEAMSWAKPVIGTAWSGNLDFMDENTAYLIPWRPGEVPEGSYILPAGSLWADPDIGAAAATMRHVWLHPDEARATGERARLSIRRTHGIEAAAQVVRARFAAIGAQLQPAGSSPA